MAQDTIVDIHLWYDIKPEVTLEKDSTNVILNFYVEDYNLEEDVSTVQLYIKKPDDTEIYGYTTVVNNKAMYSVTAQTVNVVGQCKICELHIIDSGGGNTSYPITLTIVDENVSTGSSVESASQYLAFRDVITGYSAALKLANQAKKDVDALSTNISNFENGDFTTLKNKIADTQADINNLNTQMIAYFGDDTGKDGEGNEPIATKLQTLLKNYETQIATINDLRKWYDAYYGTLNELSAYRIVQDTQEIQVNVDETISSYAFPLTYQYLISARLYQYDTDSGAWYLVNEPTFKLRKQQAGDDQPWFLDTIINYVHRNDDTTLATIDKYKLEVIYVKSAQLVNS